MPLHLDKILYTAEATVEGGREGHGKTSDGRLEVDLSIPEAVGGKGGPGTNPEELFAIGYAACFQSAFLSSASGTSRAVCGSRTPWRVSRGQTGNGCCGLSVALGMYGPHRA